MSIVARHGDLTNTHAKGVVNAGNTSLWLGSGVAGAIRTAGGSSVQNELNRIRAVRHHGGAIPIRVCQMGECVVTHAGNMKAKFVLHAAVMDCQGTHKGQTNLDIVRVATINTLLTARTLNISGLAFPVFGTGVGGLDLAAATKVMVEAMNDYADPDCLIRIYGYSEAQYATVAALVDLHARK